MEEDRRRQRPDLVGRQGDRLAFDKISLAGREMGHKGDGRQCEIDGRRGDRRQHRVDNSRAEETGGIEAARSDGRQ
ncbi:hypothetical protein ACLOJK_000620 [Asimina triloba]